MKIMKRSLSLILVFVVLVVIAAGCGSQGGKEASKTSVSGKTLIYGAESEFEKINPVLDDSPVDTMIFSGLTKFDENNRPVPDLATSWDISSDNLTYTFHLRKDVKWHDGQPFTANDVKFTIDSILNPKNNSLIKEQFEEIKSVDVIDNYTVKISLKKPFPPILDNLTRGIVPIHILSGKDLNSVDFNSGPIGTGPFKFAEWKKGESFTLQANTGYYGGKPKLDKIVIKFIPDMNVRAIQLETGEIDVALLEPQQLARVEKSEKNKVYLIPTADYRAMMYNFRKPLWQDVKVRQAINYAVNRDNILQGVLLGHGKVAYGPLQLNWANNENVEKYGYNPEKAKALLAEAGWKPGPDGILTKNGQKFSFRLTTFNNDPIRVAIVNALSTELKKIGVEAIPDPRARGTFKWPEVDAFLLGWGSPFDPDDHTYKLFHSSQIENGWNLGAYRDAEIDRLLEEARTTLDENKRKELYGKFQKRLAENPPYNFLVYLDAVWVVNKNVTGIKPKTLGHHGAGFLWNIEEWDKQ